MIGHLLNRAAEVWRHTVVDDGTGGQASTWIEHAEVTVRISQPTGDESRVGPVELGRLTHQVYALPGTDIRRGDQIRTERLADDPRDGPLVLRVMRTLTPSQPIYLRADCEELQPERE